MSKLFQNINDYILSKTRRNISSMSSMAKLKDSRCFITRWRVFYKRVQLVQGLLRSFQSPSSFFLIFLKKISYLFLFLRNFKISFPSVFTVYLGLFLREKRRKKTLQLTSINFCLTSGGGICDALRESPWRARCTREAKYELVQRHYIKIYQASFSFKSCKIYSPLTYVKSTVKKC